MYNIQQKGGAIFMNKKVICLVFFIFTTITLVGCKDNYSVPNINDESPSDINDTNFSKTDLIDEETKEDTNIIIPSEPVIYMIGSNGEEVYKIQQYLKNLEYDVSIDGNYGRGTQEAIKDFQTRNGLTVDGEVGETTLSILKEAPTDKTKYTPIDYSKFNTDTVEDKESFMNMNTFYSETPYFIVVNFNRKEVNIFQGENKKWKLINTFLCDIGSSSTPTVTGRFRTNLKGESFGQDKGYKCKYFTQIYEGILFHSIVYNLDGSIRDGRLGYAISHGCVRLATENAKWIYEYIPKDTQVILK